MEEQQRIFTLETKTDLFTGYLVTSHIHTLIELQESLKIQTFTKSGYEDDESEEHIHCIDYETSEQRHFRVNISQDQCDLVLASKTSEEAIRAIIELLSSSPLPRVKSMNCFPEYGHNQENLNRLETIKTALERELLTSSTIENFAQNGKKRTQKL